MQWIHILVVEAVICLAHMMHNEGHIWRSDVVLVFGTPKTLPDLEIFALVLIYQCLRV